jgi:Family of unknown function (DUF6064)
MPEWWSYSLSDFLLFSPRTYYRLIERYNETVWPLHLLAAGLGVAIGLVLRRPTPARSRAVFATMALLWIWVSWSFVWRRYATINWAASYLVWLLLIEAGLLLWLGAVSGRLTLMRRAGAWGYAGTATFLAGLVLYPMFAPMLGRGLSQAEVFGVIPEPTAVTTLGVLLFTEGSSRWLAVVPMVLWCLAAGATLYAMRSAEAWLPAAAAILALAGLRARAIAAT